MISMNSRNQFPSFSSTDVSYCVYGASSYRVCILSHRTCFVVKFCVYPTANFLGPGRYIAS